jgi:hypothetical protein
MKDEQESREGREGRPSLPRRRLCNVVMILSALFTVVTGALWVRSYSANDFVFYRFGVASPSGETWSFISNCGRIKLGYQKDDVPTAAGLHYQRHEPTPWTGLNTFWNRIGFAWDAASNYRVQGFTIDYQSLIFPHWLVIFILATGPAATLVVRAKQGCGGRGEAPP